MMRNSESNISDSTMRERLAHAARQGDILMLYVLNEQDPHLLDRIDAVPLIETPMHTAATVGQTTFALEVMIARPSFARKLNPFHLSPMHLALENDYLDTASRLFAVDKDLVRVKGKGGRTPMHFAVVMAKVEILDEFLVGCPDSLSDVTTQKETALHLAVKNNRLKSFGMLAEHIDLNNRDKMFKLKDDQGHTALHLMVMNKQVKMINGLALYYRSAGWMFGINELDKHGHTAMDIALDLHRKEPSADIELIKKILHRSGGNVANVKFRFFRNFSVKDWYHYFSRKYKKMINSDAQNALLVVAVLIASVTFQVAVTPPGGYWQDTIALPSNTTSYHGPTPVYSYNNNNANITYHGNPIWLTTRPYIFAGNPIWLTTRPYIFLGILYVNFMAFLTSVSMIVLLTLDLPLKYILRTSLGFLTITYILALPLRLRILMIPVISSLVGFVCAVIMGRHASRRVKFKFIDGHDDDIVEIDIDGRA